MRTLIWAAALLSLERLFYIWLCHGPRSFVAVCRSPLSGSRVDPVRVVGWVFTTFKLLQIGVITWWCVVFGDGHPWPPAARPAAISGGALLIAGGQALNVSVFRRLGRLGVFYGGQLGRRVRWRDGFPFSWFRHPQYVGAVMTIWGVLLILRYPAPDWTTVPLLETAYYWLSTKLESYKAARSTGDAPLPSEN